MSGQGRAIPQRIAWYGRDDPPIEPVELRAGPITALLEDGYLRSIRLGDLEIVRRVYVAVRAVNWDTAPGERTNLKIDRGSDRFRISYVSVNRLRDIAFRWLAEIEGTADGTITFSMRGTAEAEFEYGRIGLCVLHPPATCAGRPYRAQTPDRTVEGLLPILIEPQRKDRGISQSLIPWFSGLSISLDDLEVRFELDGDLFGIEDQRNWTDASFKTYSTPPIRGTRRMARVGDEHHQQVSITVRGPAMDRQRDRLAAQGTGAHAAGEVTPTALTLGPDLGVSMPRLGLAVASHGEALTEREIDLLRDLRLDHLRADVRLWEPGFPGDLSRAANQAAALSCGLELALFVSDDGAAELTRFSGVVSAGLLDKAQVRQVLVFHEPGAALGTTPGHWVELARARLSRHFPDALFGGGTNGYFAELTRSRPETRVMDIVSYTANPQVHAFDETSLVENLETLATTVRSARSFCGDREIAVSRLTLKPPFNQDDPGPAMPRPGELPASVDPRQMSLFGAGWTLGALKYLAEAGVASVTLYETTGWAGLIEREAGCELPGAFPSQPGMVFPSYHVLADLADWRTAGRLTACESDDPSAVVGFGVRTPGDDSIGPTAPGTDGPVTNRWRIMLANLGHSPRTALVRTLPVGVAALRARSRSLNAASASESMFDPRLFRSRWFPLNLSVGEVSVRLAPYEIAAVEIEQTS